jgi:hypothetical protein
MARASRERGNYEVHNDRPSVLTALKLSDKRLVGRRLIGDNK